MYKHIIMTSLHMYQDKDDDGSSVPPFLRLVTLEIHNLAAPNALQYDKSTRRQTVVGPITLL